MRIIAGEKRSRKIDAPEGQDTRPTADRIKEALFSMLQARIPGARVLDLYAGSGALSLEALSRGASFAVLVDVSFKAGKVIKKNIETLSYQQKTRFIQAEDSRAITMLEGENEKFDLIFLDPPYRMDTKKTCERLVKKLLQDDGMIVCEHDKTTPPDVPEGLQLFNRREYGITGLSFFVKTEVEA